MTHNVHIYLTQQPLEGRRNVTENVVNMSNTILFAIDKFYRYLLQNPNKIAGWREKTGLTQRHRVAWDTGGFQLLVGKVTPQECDPIKALAVLKSIGITKDDLPIQLDLPPRYHLPPAEKQALIEQSAINYHIMRADPDIGDLILPVVHGWTAEELMHSIGLLDDPDAAAKVSAGSFLTRHYMFEHMDPSKSRLGSGSFLSGTAGGNGFMDSALQRHAQAQRGIAAGSHLTRNYGDDVLQSHAQERRMLAAGSHLTKNYIGSSLVRASMQHRSAEADIVAAGSFMSQRSGTNYVFQYMNPHPAPRPGLAVGTYQASMIVPPGTSPSKTVATGSYLPASTRSKDKMTRNLAAPGTITFPEKTSQKAPEKAVFERLALVCNLFRDRSLFILGGGSQATCHMIFLAGAQMTDTTSWRMAGLLGELFIPHNGRRAIGQVAKSPRPSEEDLKILRECLKDETHPFYGMSLWQFLKIAIFRYVKDWRADGGYDKYSSKPFELRALHNAWVLKHYEEAVANEYANDPDRYKAYLEKRFQGHPNLMRQLEFLWSRLKRPYVQDRLELHLNTS